MRSLILLMVLVATAAHSSAPIPPSDVHILMPYPPGKADSVMASSDPYVFIPTPELKALQAVVEHGIESAKQLPVPGIVSSVEMWGDLGAEVITLKARYVVDILDTTTVYVPLAGEAVPVLSVSKNGSPLIIQKGRDACVVADTQNNQTGNFWGVFLDGSGRHELTVEIMMRIRESDNGGYVEIPLPSVGTARIDIAVPEEDWELRSNRGETISEMINGKPHVIMYPGRGGNVRIDWEQIEERIVPEIESAKEARIEAKSMHVLSLGEAAVKGSGIFDYRVWAGQAQLLKIGVPRGVEIMALRGANVEVWERMEDEIHIYLSAPVRGQERISIEYLITLDGPSGLVSVPLFTAGGVQRQWSEYAVVATTNIEVTMESQEGMEVIQSRELPDELRNRSSGRILVAFRGDPMESAATLRISRHRDVPVLVASIDHALLETTVYPSGEHITRCRYSVRNTTKQFLEFELPEGAQLWHVRVNREPVRPGVVDGRVLLPLASSVGRGMESSFPVEITYMIPGKKIGFSGTMNIRGPSPDLPCSKLDWTVSYPDDITTMRWTGNVEKVEIRRQTSARISEADGIRDKAMRMEETIASEVSDESGLNVRSEREEARRYGFDAESSAPGAAQQWDYDRKAGKEADQLGRIMAQQALKTKRRSVGKPSVDVFIPTIGARVSFSQILQQGEIPEVSCLYSRVAPRSVTLVVAGLALVFILGTVVIRSRRKAALLFICILLPSLAWADESTVQKPREVIQLLPRTELDTLFGGALRKEMAFLPISRIRNLIRQIGSREWAGDQAAMVSMDDVSIRSEAGEDELVVSGSGTLVGRGSGWCWVDILSSRARPVRVEVDGKPASLWSFSQSSRLLLKDVTRKKIAFEYIVPISLEGNSRSASIPLIPAGGVRMEVILPDGSSGLKVDGTRIDIAETRDGMKATIPLAGRESVNLNWRYVSPELVLPSAERPREQIKTEGKILGEGYTLFSLDANVIEGITNQTLEIIQGSVDTLKYRLRPGLELLDVASSSLVDWVLVEEKSLLNLLLKPGTRGRVSVNLIYEISREDSLSEVDLFEPVLTGAMRYRGETGIQVLSSLRVTTVGTEVATRIDPGDLPTSLWNQATNPILYAYKYIDPSYSIRVRMEQQEDIPLLIASVDQQAITSVLSPTGRMVTRSVMLLRNSGEQFLKVRLPEGAQIWSYMVDNRSFAPGRGEDGSYRLPVSASQDVNGELMPLTLELVWAEERGSLPAVGKIEFSGPELEVPCSFITWNMYLPDKKQWYRAGGTMQAGARGGIMPVTRVAAGMDDYIANRQVMNINEGDMPVSGEGFEAGALPIKAQIPLEGKRKDYHRYMLLEGTPTVTLFLTNRINRVLVSIIGIVVLLIVWKSLLGFSRRNLIWLLALTIIVIIITGFMSLLGAAIAVVWKYLEFRRLPVPGEPETEPEPEIELEPKTESGSEPETDKFPSSE